MNRPIKIGLLAEGEAELGRSVPYLKPQDGGKPIDKQKEGTLHTLIRRELATIGITECAFINRHPTSKENQKGKVTVGYPVGNKKYVRQTVISWKPSEVDLIVIVLDSDDQLEKRRSMIEQALDIIRTNQFDEHDELINDQSVGGLAVKNLEAWLLADEEAFATVLAVNFEESLPRNLETLPADESSEDFAKNIFDKQVVKSSFMKGANQNIREINARWEIAKVISLDEIRAKCNTGYTPLFDDLKLIARNFLDKHHSS